jgi:hypothetical protein
MLEIIKYLTLDEKINLISANQKDNWITNTLEKFKDIIIRCDTCSMPICQDHYYNNTCNEYAQYCKKCVGYNGCGLCKKYDLDEIHHYCVICEIIICDVCIDVIGWINCSSTLNRSSSIKLKCKNIICYDCSHNVGTNEEMVFKTCAYCTKQVCNECCEFFNGEWHECDGNN